VTEWVPNDRPITVRKRSAEGCAASPHRGGVYPNWLSGFARQSLGPTCSRIAVGHLARALLDDGSTSRNAKGKMRFDSTPSTCLLSLLGSTLGCLSTVLSCGEAGGARPSASAPLGTGGAVLAEMPSDDPDEGVIDTTMPADFTKADIGGWKLGPEVSEQDGPDAGTASEVGRSDTCGSRLTGVARDFMNPNYSPESGHPDFGTAITELQKGLVLDEIGAHGKPILGPDIARGNIQSPQSFAQWYEATPGVNMPYFLELFLEPNGDKFTFASNGFFPVDNVGFGNEYLDHNYHFTFELHIRFLYKGGEIFEFTGDDDLWVFINGRLAIDLGGVHGALPEQADLDLDAQRLGIEVGNEYPLDFFQAERWCCGSNFKIETTLMFTDCGARPIIL